MEFYEYSDEEINEIINIKMNVYHQYYIDQYEKDIHKPENLNDGCVNDEDKS